MPDFVGFPKIYRLSSEMIITEKIDGTNAQIFFENDSAVYVGSRKRWLTLENDNYGFYRWVHDNLEELLKLGPGHHFGEWWGNGIQRNYGLKEKRFSLFNVHRWDVRTIEAEKFPECCSVVPVLARLDKFDTIDIQVVMRELKEEGSMASPGFMNPEGVVIYHVRSQNLYKKTFESDNGKEKRTRETKRLEEQIKKGFDKVGGKPTDTLISGTTTGDISEEEERWERNVAEYKDKGWL